MSFTEAIPAVLRNYAGFTGRARRSEFWWWVLFTFLLGIVTSILDNVLGTTIGNGPFASGYISNLVSLALLVPNIAVSVRRLHDTGRSGWWVLLGLIVIVGWIILIVWNAQDSKPGPNEHGPNPKEVGTPGTAPIAG